MNPQILQMNGVIILFHGMRIVSCLTYNTLQSVPWGTHWYATISPQFAQACWYCRSLPLARFIFTTSSISLVRMRQTSFSKLRMTALSVFRFGTPYNFTSVIKQMVSQDLHLKLFNVSVGRSRVFEKIIGRREITFGMVESAVVRYALLLTAAWTTMFLYLLTDRKTKKSVCSVSVQKNVSALVRVLPAAKICCVTAAVKMMCILF